MLKNGLVITSSCVLTTGRRLCPFIVPGGLVAMTMITCSIGPPTTNFKSLIPTAPLLTMFNPASTQQGN
jgi:hypothetical protein